MKLSLKIEMLEDDLELEVSEMILLEKQLIGESKKANYDMKKILSLARQIDERNAQIKGTKNKLGLLKSVEV